MTYLFFLPIPILSTRQEIQSFDCCGYKYYTFPAKTGWVVLSRLVKILENNPEIASSIKTTGGFVSTGKDLGK